jgi:UDP-N-acetylmuramate: L-alanyl-gamma-D-glutamyl-meso-diaminopimelate ligase
MLSWIFEVADTKPSFLIGGIAENFDRSFQLGSGRHFIIEGDEYDTAFFDKGPKFLHYFPDSVILTSVEFDHADIYKDLDAVETAFKRLVNLVPRRGRIVAFDSCDSVNRCVARAFCPVERYGRNGASTWRIENLKFGAESTSWSLLRNGKSWGELEFPLAGEYNVWNASAAAAMAASYDIPAGTIKEALKRFQSVKRRLEVKAEVSGITIIDDFAHHPTAIAGTLTALRGRYTGRRLWAILEPRSNTLRRNVFQDELANSLAIADEIVIANVFKSESIPEHERLDVGTLAAQLGREGHHARVLADVDSIVKICSPEMRPGDVIAILSNGGFGGIYEKLPEKLRSLSLAPASEVATRSQG